MKSLNGNKKNRTVIDEQSHKIKFNKFAYFVLSEIENFLLFVSVAAIANDNFINLTNAWWNFFNNDLYKNKLNKTFEINKNNIQQVRIMLDDVLKMANEFTESLTDEVSFYSHNDYFHSFIWDSNIVVLSNSEYNDSLSNINKKFFMTEITDMSLRAAYIIKLYCQLLTKILAIENYNNCVISIFEDQIDFLDKFDNPTKINDQYFDLINIQNCFDYYRTTDTEYTDNSIPFFEHSYHQFYADIAKYLDKFIEGWIDEVAVVDVKQANIGNDISSNANNDNLFINDEILKQIFSNEDTLNILNETIIEKMQNSLIALFTNKKNYKFTYIDEWVFKKKSDELEYLSNYFQLCWMWLVAKSPNCTYETIISSLRARKKADTNTIIYYLKLWEKIVSNLKSDHPQKEIILAHNDDFISLFKASYYTIGLRPALTFAYIPYTYFKEYIDYQSFDITKLDTNEQFKNLFFIKTLDFKASNRNCFAFQIELPFKTEQKKHIFYVTTSSSLFNNEAIKAKVRANFKTDKSIKRVHFITP